MGRVVGRGRETTNKPTRLAIGKRKLEELQRTLRESEERFRRLAETTASVIFTYRGKKLTYVNPVTEVLTGYPSEQLLAMELTEIIHPSFRATLDEQLGSPKIDARGGARNQIKIVTRSGEERWLDLTTGVIDVQGEPTGVGTAYDITALKNAEEQLRILAYHDGLTGLPNRAMMKETLRRLIHRTKRRPDQVFCVLYLDLDDFKMINDSLGHIIGDKLLAGIARRLEECIRSEDMVARLGGDEFAVVLPEVRTAADGIRVAKRIHDRVKGSLCLDGRDVFTTTSIGIAFSDPSLARAEDLLGAADTAMYRAKEQGKSRYEIFDRAMHTMAVERLQLETDLQWGIERQEFRALYQPIVELKGGRLCGFEALARWQHPTRGLLPAADFIPVAEETGMIIPIGWLILQNACRQLKEWQDRYPGSQHVYVHVNLSGKQFMLADMVEQVVSALRETGLDAHKLRLEIVESMLMDNAASTHKVLSQLKELGVQLLIDDFGTGYSSLSYLHRFPTSGLKIDRSFVNGIDESWSNAELVKTIITICQGMSMDVIAEGIETFEQMTKLVALGCKYGQGYYFSMPMEASRAVNLLRGNSRQGLPEHATGPRLVSCGMALSGRDARQRRAKRGT